MTEEELFKDMWHHLNVTIKYDTEQIRKALKEANYNIDLAIKIAFENGPIDLGSGSYCDTKVDCMLGKTGYLRGWYPEHKYSQQKPDIELNIKQIFEFIRDNGIRATQPSLLED